MRTIVEPRVHEAIDEFYDAAIFQHRHTLSYETVENKKQRLYAGIQSLDSYYRIFGTARLKQDWIKNGWQEFICEDFHFAFEHGYDPDGVETIIVRDAVHSLLYR